MSPYVISMQAFSIILTLIITLSMVAQSLGAAKSFDQYRGPIGRPGKNSSIRSIKAQIFGEAYLQNPISFPSSSPSIFNGGDFLDVKPALQEQWPSTGADNFLTGDGEILPLLLTPGMAAVSENGLSSAGMNLKLETDFDNRGSMENHKFMNSKLLSCGSSEKPASIEPAEQRRKAEMIEKRRIRMLKNRESAARSRARKQALVRQLEKRVFHMKKHRESLQRKKEVLTRVWSSAIPEIRRISSDKY